MNPSTPYTSTFREKLDRAARSVHEKPFEVLVLLVLLYLAPTLLRGMRRFWYDELFTFHMSQLPSMGHVIQALKGGADLNPPLYYVIIRTFQFIFGNGELATRLPSILGFLIMSACLYRFASRKRSPLYGFIAALCPWCSGAYPYSVEARPYGLVLGFAGLALVCWQEACANDQPDKRRWFLFGFSVSLSCALLTHCYAMFLLVPFGLAELVRFRESRKPDFAMWAALCIPAGWIATYVPLLMNLKPYVCDNYFFKVPWTMVGEVYNFISYPLLLPLAIGGFLLAWPTFLPKPSTTADKSSSKTIPAHEWPVAIGFALIPALSVLFAKGISSQYFPRYGISGVIGVSLLISLYLIWRGTPTPGAALAALALLVCFEVRSATWFADIVFPPETSSESPSLQGKLRNQDPLEVFPDLPIVAASGIQFIEMDHYASKSVAERLYFLTDRPISLEYTQSDIFSTGFPGLARLFPLRTHLAGYNEFLRTHHRFLVYGPYFFPNDWLLKKLIDDRIELHMISDRKGAFGDNLLFEAIVPDSFGQTAMGH